VPEPKVIDEPNVVGSPDTVALCIGSIAQELGQLAKANGLDTLSYILDMARLEADEVSKGSTAKDRWVDSRPSRRSS
jgi:hypothetical protein